MLHLECHPNAVQKQFHTAHIARRRQIASRAVFDRPINLTDKSKSTPTIKLELAEPMDLIGVGPWASLKPWWPFLALPDQPTAARLNHWPPDFLTHIKKTTAAYYHKSVIDLASARRQVDIILPRHMAMYLCKTLTLKSMPEIGRAFGNRDHTTVLHAFRKIRGLIHSDFTIRTQAGELQDKLEQDIARWRSKSVSE